MLRKQLLFVTGAISMLALVLVLGAGCGSINKGHPGDPGVHGGEPSNDESEITVSAVDFEFDPSEITIQTGETVLITLQNEDEIEHDLQVDGLTIEPMGDMDMTGDHAGADAGMLALHTTPGETAELTFRTDQTGTFEFYCTIEGHREAGMVGTLTVRGG